MATPPMTSGSIDSTSLEDAAEVGHSDRLSVLSNTGLPLTHEDHFHFLNHQHRSLCLRHIPFHYRDADLRRLVAKLLDLQADDSRIETCRVKYNRHDGVGKPMQVGYVMLQTAELAQTVLQRLEAAPRHDGRDIRVAPFRGNVDMESSQDGSVFFKFKSKSMKPRITEEVIRAHLEPRFGALQSLCIKAHYWKPKMKGQDGYGFVAFETAAANDRATASAERIRIDFVSYAFGSIKHADLQDDRPRSLSPSSLETLEAPTTAGRRPQKAPCAAAAVPRTSSPSSLSQGTSAPPPSSSGSFYLVQPPPPSVVVSPSPSPPPLYHHPTMLSYVLPPSPSPSPSPSMSDAEVICQLLPDGSHRWVRARVIGPAMPVYGGRLSPPLKPRPDDGQPVRVDASFSDDRPGPPYAPSMMYIPVPVSGPPFVCPPPPSPFDGSQPPPLHDHHLHAHATLHRHPPLPSASQYPPAPQMFMVYQEPPPMYVYCPTLALSPAGQPPGPPPSSNAVLPPQQQQAASPHALSHCGHPHR